MPGAPMQIIVLGMHRSGTSAVTRLVNMMGAYIGPEGSSLRPDPNNPRGYWEHMSFLRANQQMLQFRGCTWFDVSRWDEAAAGPLPDRLRVTMASAVHQMDAHRPWVLKDPRFCVTLPEWTPWLGSAIALVVARDPLEIARSLERRHSIPASYGVALWEYYAVGIVRNAIALPRVFMSHDDLMAAPVDRSTRLLADLRAAGVPRLAPPAATDIRSFIEPDLHRSRASEVSLRLTADQERLESMLRGELDFDPGVAVSPESRTLISSMPPEIRAKFADLTQYARKAGA